MKVKDLIIKLQSMPQELEVYGYCDHSQSPEKVSSPGVIYLEKDVHTIYDYEYTTDEEEAEE